MIQNQKPCACCGKPMIRKRFNGGRLEVPSAFKLRKYCSLACANTKRQETRQKRQQEASDAMEERQEVVATPRTALEILILAMNDTSLPWIDRISAAKAVAPYQARKVGSSGKKEDSLDAAKTAANGRFASRPAPSNVIDITAARKP